MKILCWVFGHKWLDFTWLHPVEPGIRCRRCNRVEHMAREEAEATVKTARWYEWGAIPDLEEEDGE